ncbi:MAG: transposase [Verrucomicrobiaceae bacterium]|nr:transposase [Verrucomicrobiaceae bacterium]
MNKEVLYLGLDVHAENIAVAIAEAERDGELRSHGEIPNTFHSIDKLLRKLGHPDKELRVCYEAGPCGFVLARFLKKKGIACDVIAPSLTPKGSGDKIKTDRRDARMLARLHRAGELTAVHIPDERDEAIRELTRRLRTPARGFAPALQAVDLASVPRLGSAAHAPMRCRICAVVATNSKPFYCATATAMERRPRGAQATCVTSGNWCCRIQQ